MTEWLDKAFSGGVSLSRVNPIGVGIMFFAVILLISAQPISNRCSKCKIDLSIQAIRFAGLLVCALGTLIAIL